MGEEEIKKKYRSARNYLFFLLIEYLTIINYGDAPSLFPLLIIGFSCHSNSIKKE